MHVFCEMNCEKLEGLTSHLMVYCAILVLFVIIEYVHVDYSLLTEAVLCQIVLKAERRRGKHGEIAVDDFSLRRGACSDGHDRTE